jgi:anti-sigma factor RsiW
VSAYLDDELDSKDRADVEAHLSICPGCLEYLSQMRITVGSLRDIGSDDLPPSVVSLLLAAFSEAHPHPGNDRDPGLLE